MKVLIPDSIRFSKTRPRSVSMHLWSTFVGPLHGVMFDTAHSDDFIQSDCFPGRSVGNDFERWLTVPSWESACASWAPVHFAL